MAIAPVSIANGVFTTSVGGSVEDTLRDLKSQRRELQQQMKNGDSSLAEKADSLDKRIHNLEKRVDRVTGKEECQTCKNRKYKDGSDDPGVSFKTASKITGNVTAAVLSHENEHVTRERASAAREGKEVVSQYVKLKTAICPECGKSYTSGGETVTVTRPKQADKFSAGIEKAAPSGSRLNSAI